MRDGGGAWYRRLSMILICLLTIGFHSLAFRSSGIVFGSPLTEDGYYVATIARNIARGIGFSGDGKTLTNGFHPLWAILTSVFFGATGEAAEPSIRILLAVSAVLAVLAAVQWSSLWGGVFNADNRLYRAVAGPWFIYNLVLTGNLTPVQGWRSASWRIACWAAQRSLSARSHAMASRVSCAKSADL
jgi:hypothetical protein